MFSAEITTFLIGATPISELRGAIPWGLTFGGLSNVEVFIFAVAGNIFSAVMVVLLLPILTKFARKYSKFLDRILQKIFEKTRAKHSKNFRRFEALFLVILVAVPLPGSGGYTGALVAWLFGVKPKVAIPLITIGILIAGFLVLGITTGGLALAGSS